VLLTGGSAFGLDAAGGVMKKLEEVKIGRNVAVTVVPNVCAAVLFDLKCGDASHRPDAAMGYAACEAALRGDGIQNGCFGAGTGATIGKLNGLAHAMKGGIGSFAFQQGELMVGAVIAVNCVGDVLDKGEIIAGCRNDSLAGALCQRPGCLQRRTRRGQYGDRFCGHQCSPDQSPGNKACRSLP
jgi:L-aminopeptidase/D-esterase-like protein